MTQARSIHHERRWYYVLWCTLLAASLAALGLWETPSRTGSADLAFQVRIMNLPPGCAAQLWAGPKKAWPAADQRPPLSQAGRPLPAGGEVIGSLKLRVGYRRWVGGYIPRRTDDLAILKVQPKTGTARYYAFPLDQDWQTRVLHPGQRMKISGAVDWDGLWLDSASVPKTNRQ